MTRLLLTVAVTVALAGPASAYDFPFGLFKRKTSKESSAAPSKAAKQSVNTLSTSPDESARKQAAEELRGLDPRSNPEVFPALIGALQKDPSPVVRVAAADTVGRLKPVYQPAGIVLEQVAKTDPDAKVRDAAESALLQYHLGGYVTPVGQRGPSSAEPPIAPPKLASSGVPIFRPITITPPGKGVFYPPTPEPPLSKKVVAPPAAAKPVSTPTALPPGVPQPMPAVLPPPVPSVPTLPPPETTTPAPSVPSGPLPPITVPPPPG